MSYSEEHLHDVVKSQLADAIVTSHVRSPVKLAEYMRRELQEFEADYPGTIEAAWRKLHPDPEYVDPGLYVAIDYQVSDVEVGRDAIAAFREHMGWTRPAKTERLEHAHGDVRGFTRPELHLVMPDLEPDDEPDTWDDLHADEDDLDDDAIWNQEPA